jgi:hypothetical protein
MMRLLKIGLALTIAGLSPALHAKTPEAAPVEVMVLGAYHFGNPGLDVNNMKADSVLTPDRQTELDRLARALLAFRPTKVMVERVSDTADLADSNYARFTVDKLKTESNEISQIGYRVARLAALSAVQAIDEQPKAGEPDYFPFDTLMQTAQKHGQTSVIEQANSRVQSWMKSFEAAQKSESISQLLVRMNDPSSPTYGMDFYYAVLPVGDNDVQSGADLNAMWYLRNAKIFAKLMRSTKPGDRVIVVYGAGHAFWLSHFARYTPGYRFVDPMPYLKRAGGRAR